MHSERNVSAVGPGIAEGRDAPASLDLAGLFEQATRIAADQAVSLPGCRRFVLRTQAGISFVFDRFDTGAECLFTRAPIARDEVLKLSLSTDYRIAQSPSGGWLLSPDRSDGAAYWMPQPPMLRRIDPQGRILAEQPAKIADFSASRAVYTVGFEAALDSKLDLVIWRFSSEGHSFTEEITRLLSIETHGIFLWGSHARVDRAADIYRHVVHGAVYDIRFAWPHNRKCCSENEAHALYVALAGLGAATSKRIYRVLQQQLALCLLARQACDGGWYHGLWTETMECHYRLHASGVHLLMDEYARQPSEPLRAALARAIDFLSQQTDRIDAGDWLLHDSLEKSEQALKQGPFGWVESRALTKATTNMLVLNTHLDSSIAFDRYATVTRDTAHESLILSARKSTERVLTLRTAEWLYRPLFAAIELTLLPVATAQALPALKRALKRVAWKYLIPRLPALKSRWPRLQMPNGYIDRELSLKTWAFDYHSINIMDLLRHHRRFGDKQSMAAALDGIRFAQRISLPERLAEVKGREYSLGFWVEALYHWCTLSDEFDARRALAGAMLKLVETGLGIPPSLLGANSEAVTPAAQIACPVPTDARLRVGNLCRDGTREILVVNPSSESVKLAWLQGGDAAENLTWIGSAGDVQIGADLTVPARGFLSGTAKTR